MKLENEVIDDGRVIELDGSEISGCTFKRCTLRYSGGTLPALATNRFLGPDCRWEFAGAASNTLHFLHALYAGGGHPLIEATFENIRGKRNAPGLLH